MSNPYPYSGGYGYVQSPPYGLPYGYGFENMMPVAQQKQQIAPTVPLVKPTIPSKKLPTPKQTKSKQVFLSLAFDY